MFLNPESFLYRLKTAESLWDLKKNVQFAATKSHCILIPWKSGELKVQYAVIVIQKRSTNTIQEVMLE